MGDNRRDLVTKNIQLINRNVSQMWNSTNSRKNRGYPTKEDNQNYSKAKESALSLIKQLEILIHDDLL